MAETRAEKYYKPRFIISLAACIFIGLLFLVSGSGKIFEFGMVPGQTLDFVAFILPESWLNEGMLMFLDILIGWIVPLSELAIGLMLLAGFFPRIVAIFVIPLSLVFLANNIFSIYIGMNEYEKCTCFGIWGTIFGSLTPLQSMSLDIVLLILALIIIIITPIAFRSSQQWLRGGKKTPAETEVK
jgi:uncharacterized membrane protein YphA (DoxX/SURF4 family)